MSGPLLLIDTHCHLDAQHFREGPDEVLARAKEVGVFACVVVGVGESVASARAAVELARRHPGEVVAACGVHPHDARLYEAQAGELADLAVDEHVVAVGEIGLDYHYDYSPRDVQRDVFARQVDLGRQLKKPIVVHTREAGEDTLAVLASERAGEVGGVIHCFSEDRAFAERALDLGFYLSFSGIVTFKGAATVHEVARFAPLDRVLVETDSPYLAPVPKRGKRCEPAYVVHTAARVAELRGMPVEALVEATTENATRLFGDVFRAPAR